MTAVSGSFSFRTAPDLSFPPASQAIVCGAARSAAVTKSQICVLCGNATAPHMCSWVAPKLVDVPVEGIVIDDRVACVHDSKQGQTLMLWRVSDITESPCGFTFYLEFRVNAKQISYSRRFGWRGSTFEVERPAPCGNRCCDVCSAERSEQFKVCALHWREVRA